MPSDAQSIRLSDSQAVRIGAKIWQNESGGTIAGLTAWNHGEDFASLRIGHFIWYPAGRRGRAPGKLSAASTVPLQAKFAAARLEAALPKMLDAAPAREREKIRRDFYRVAAEPLGP